jgi:hypothetical protein
VIQAEVSFTPSPDVSAVLNALLDRFERRAAGAQPRSIKILFGEVALPTYFSQVDPEPRQVANEQFQKLESQGLVVLGWLAGEKGHLLESARLLPERVGPLYQALKRVPAAHRQARLEDQLLGERFRFGVEDWRYRALSKILAQLKTKKSPAPFSLSDSGFNEDLLTALSALSHLEEETSYRVFSVHTFNDSKRFIDLKSAILRLAKLGQPEWKRLLPEEVLRELNLVANPGYLFLAGPWELVDELGQVLSLDAFIPSVGLPAIQAAHLQRVTTRAEVVICIENLTTFHEMSRLSTGPGRPALICLMGNPSPACRHLLSCLEQSQPEPVPIYVWADLDYGGLNILAQLRQQVSPFCRPYRMDAETLDAFAAFARPLTQNDRRNFARLCSRPDLSDMGPVIAHLLRRGIKLEQEAISIKA